MRNNDEKNESVIAFLKAKMHETGMNQTDMAEKMGIAQSSYSRIMSQNRNVTEKTLTQISTIFHISKDDILNFDRDEVSEEKAKIVSQKFQVNATVIANAANRATLSAVRKKSPPHKSVRRGLKL